MPRPMQTPRRGSAMAIALAFMVVVTLSGLVMLSVSYMHQEAVADRSLDVRMVAAAEAGIESKRGRFTLVAGVQDDWNALLPSAGWNPIDDPMVINGLTVQVEAMPVGDADVPRARIRGVVQHPKRSLAVEYVIRVASFADYSLYMGSTNTTYIGSNFKLMGNWYSKGHINLNNNPGIQFYGHVTTSKSVLNAPDYDYNFPYENPLEDAPEIEIPPAAYGMDVMEAVAVSMGAKYYANTISIEFDGQDFIRTYYYRFQGSGPGSPGDYVEVSETVAIPDDGVIFVSSDECPEGVDTYAAGSGPRNRETINIQQGMDIWGVLDEVRVTLACEHQVNVTNTSPTRLCWTTRICVVGP